MAMTVTAFAADGDVKLSITNPVDGHTYSYYQLLVGDLADGKLSNVKWGANVASSITYKEKADENATEFTEDATASPVAGQPVPQAILDYLNSLSSDSQETANIIGEWVTGTGTPIPAAGADVAKGYYVIKDSYTDPTATQTTTLSTHIVQVVGPTAVEPKAGTTNHKKEVLDVNDTTDTAIDLSNLKNIAEGWDKTADHDWDDHVPFKLTTTIGSDFAKYDSYYLKVSDNLYDGLILDQGSIEVYVDGTLATEGSGDGEYLLNASAKTFSVEFNKLNGNAKAAAGKDVIIYYTAKLDKDT